TARRTWCLPLPSGKPRVVTIPKQQTDMVRKRRHRAVEQHRMLLRARVWGFVVRSTRVRFGRRSAPAAAAARTLGLLHAHGSMVMVICVRCTGPMLREVVRSQRLVD